MGFNAMQPGKVKRGDLIFFAIGVARDRRPDRVGGLVTVDADALAALDYCYLTTKGRRSGSPHTIEIWFALHGDVVYLLAGGSGDESTG